MKQRLRAGGELDLLTRDELEEIVERFAARVATEERTIRADTDTLLDANGNGEIQSVYRVPIGMEFQLHRLIVDGDGVTPGTAPQAGYFADVMRSGERVDFNTSGVPFLLTASKDAAIRFRNGEDVGVRFTKGPVNTRVRAKVQGTLKPAEDVE